MHTSGPRAGYTEANMDAQANAGVSLGKGAWDCDTNTAIPPEREVRIFCTRYAINLQTTSPFHPFNHRINHRYQTILQADVFEEIATMEFPFEGIPTVPPRKDMDHMVDSKLSDSKPEISSQISPFQILLSHIQYTTQTLHA